jgi:zinc resistance-associated protein
MMANFNLSTNNTLIKNISMISVSYEEGRYFDFLWHTPCYYKNQNWNFKCSTQGKTNLTGGKKMNKFGKIIVVVAIVGVVGYAATSFAGWGHGGGGYGQGQGGGWGQRGSGSAAPGSQGNLSDQDIDKLQKERQAFFEDTRELRENLYQKELELRSEMAKQDPDVNKAVALQKEVSELEGQLSQKRVEQRVKMQKENPDMFAGRGYGMGRGYGKGGGMGRGYGMGPGGMGRGFQGRGGGGCGQ